MTIRIIHDDNSVETKPLLSIIIPGRNDNFMFNFSYRLECTLNCLAKNLNSIGMLDQVEVIISDWGSEVPLHKVLVLNEAARALTKFLVIPPDVAEKEKKESEFPIVIIQNAAIRRAQGEFVMQTDSDVLFPVPFLTKLFSLLRGECADKVDVRKALMGSKRRHVPFSVIETNPPLNVLEKFVEKFGSQLEGDDPWEYGFCATGMMIMHRDLWFECSGYDENLVHWGWMEIDLGFRITQKYSWFDVTDGLGMELFHLEHYVPEKGGRQVVDRRKNPTNRENVFHPNSDSWGLSQYDFEMYKYPTTEGLMAYTI